MVQGVVVQTANAALVPAWPSSDDTSGDSLGPRPCSCVVCGVWCVLSRARGREVGAWLNSSWGGGSACGRASGVQQTHQQR
jgi:hypothetical protein